MTETKPSFSLLHIPHGMMTYIATQLLGGNSVEMVRDNLNDCLNVYVIDKSIDWLIVVQWYEGSTDYSIINIPTSDMANALVNKLKATYPTL